MLEVDTQSKHTEQYGLSQLLRGTFDLQTGSVGAVLHQLLHAFRMHLGLDIAFISEFTEGQRVFRYVDQAEGVNLLKVGQGDPLEESYCQKVVDGRLPELIQNAQEVEEAVKIPATKALGVGAHVSVPIRLADGSVFGTFCSFSFRADYTLNERDMALMHLLADIAASVLETSIKQARDQAVKRERIERLLASDELSMVWQPIMECESGRLAGVEALARFAAKPYRGPPEWFTEAAQAGLGAELEILAIRKGLEILACLPPNAYVACNTSAATLLGSGLAEMLTQYPLERIVLEITEHDIIEDYTLLRKKLDPLRRKGLRLAVDDAGAGYASFRHILLLQPDVIKLDISLTRDIDTDIGRHSLAVSLVQFSQKLGSSLVAEGVETQSELDTLVALGVEKAQGYLLSRPKPLTELGDILLH